jgi:hypothetical protein
MISEQPAVLWVLVKLLHVEKKVMSGEIAPCRPDNVEVNRKTRHFATKSDKVLLIVLLKQNVLLQK